MRRISSFTLSLLMLLIIAGCSSAQTSAAPTQAAAATGTPTVTMTPSATLTRRPTRTTRPTETIEPSATAVPTSQLCAPLEDVAFSEMADILQVPMQTPHPGQDDGHHGSDFAFYRFGQRANMEGLDIYSVLSGEVVSNVGNRKPYGNMIMIETHLDAIPDDLLAALEIPESVAAIAPDSRMAACSQSVPLLNLDREVRSLYVLYAHLLEPSPLKPGEKVTCGDKIGEVGNTGMSGNPHLHLELRVGPSGARFPSMAYYDTGATIEEYNTYCTWRVSQHFQILEPMKLVAAGAAR